MESGYVESNFEFSEYTGDLTSLTVESETEEINLSQESCLRMRKSPCSKVMPLSVPLCKMLRSHPKQRMENPVEYTHFEILGDRIVIGGETEESLVECENKIRANIINKLTYLELKMKMLKEVYTLTQCPTILQIYKSNDCTIVTHELSVYISSFSRTEAELDKVKKEVLDMDIWCYQWRNPRHNNSIYSYIKQYLNLMLQSKEEFFKERGIKVEINANCSQILMIGTAGAKKMQVKNTISHIHNSTVVMEVSLSNPTNEKSMEFKKLQSYVKKVTDHPVILAKSVADNYLIISKHNIVKQLICKTKFREFMAGKGNRCGFFFPENARDSNRALNLKTFAMKSFYFVEERNVFHYITDSMNKVEEDTENKYFNFIVQVLEYLVLETPRIVTHQYKEEKRSGPSRQDVFLEVGDRVPFEETKHICLKFGCDVLIHKVYINSGYLERYQKMGEEAKETTGILFDIHDWCDESKTRVVEIQKHTTKGKFYWGKLKNAKTQKGASVMYLPELILETV